MSRDQMISFALFMLKCSEQARTHGALRMEAEVLVDRWLSQGGSDVRF